MTKTFTPPERKKFNQIPLSMSAKQIILGGILGDGSLKIAKKYKNARYCERHSLTQESYLRWKFSQLHPELKGSLIISKPEKSSFSRHPKMSYQSSVSDALTELHHLTHAKNQKKVKRRWLNHLTALALAVWWCDDGSLNVTTRQGVLCTDSFSRKELLILVRYLEVDWGIHCTIIENQVISKKTGLTRIDYRLRFSTHANLQAFFRIILSYIPVPEMLFKVMICYADLEDQQRWISEVKNALPNLASEIINVYERPLEKYGHLIIRKELTPRDIFYKTRKFRQHSENDIVQHNN